MKKIIEKIKSAKRILIVSHKRPDGDSIGSQIGLILALKKIKKDVFCLNEDDVPETFRFLKGSEFVKRDIPVQKKFNLVITLDMSDLSRPGDRIEKYLYDLLQQNIFLINIDHHDSNKNFGHENFVDVCSSSTAEIVFKLLRKMNIKFDTNISNALYTGIVSDTGNFMFENTNSETFNIASKLIDEGAERQKISNEVFMSRPFAKVKLISRVVDRIKFIDDKVYSYIKLSDFDELKAKKEYTDGIVNELLKIKGVGFAVLLTEEEGNIRISFRSKIEKYNADLFARKFEGGGHYYAAGGKSSDTLEKTIKNLEKELYSL
ncbi:MAG: bifunctional oligoribonuclease/PAP phosphatase NrnA [candidate division WOR-3 bacterium]